MEAVVQEITLTLTASILRPRNQVLEISRLHLLARHRLLNGRQLENHAEHAGQRAMTPKHSVVKDEILEVAAFNRHHFIA